MSLKEFEVTEENGKKVTLAIRPPAPEDYEESDKVYAIRVASLLREKGNKRLLTRSKVDEYLRENDIWTEKDEQAIQKLQVQIDEKLNQIRRGGIKLSEGRKLSIEIHDLRVQIVKIAQKRQIFDDTTIESLAEAEKIDYLIYVCTVYAKDGTNYWESFEDMKANKITAGYRAASKEASVYIYNMDADFEQKLPENRWLKKYGFIDENFNYVDRKSGEKVDKEGKPLANVQKDIVNQINNLRGEIHEEKPFLDDETGKPVEVKEEKTEAKEEPKAPELVKTA